MSSGHRAFGSCAFPTVRLKRIAQLAVEKVHASESGLPYVGLESIESWRGNLIQEDAEADGLATRFEEGDLLFGKLRPYLAKAWRADRSGLCTGEALVLRSSGNPDFLKFCMLAPEVIRVIDGSTYGSKMPRASWEFIGDVLLPAPTLRQQRSIVAFLDRETARIDALIEKKQQLIELLEEKRQAVITEAVTRGLDPNVAKRDSGAQWIEELPKHWRVLHLRHALAESPRNGVSPELAEEGGVPTFSISAVTQGRVRILENLKYANAKPDAVRASLVSRGDVLVLRGNGNRRLVGKAGLVDEEPPEGCIYPDILIRLRPARGLHSEFLVHALNSDYMRAQLELASRTSSGIWKITGEAVSGLELALPEPLEQLGIVRLIETNCASLDAAQQRVEQSIALLRERRSALITAAVTGQIDISEAA